MRRQRFHAAFAIVLVFLLSGFTMVSVAAQNATPTSQTPKQAGTVATPDQGDYSSTSDEPCDAGMRGLLTFYI